MQNEVCRMKYEWVEGFWSPAANVCWRWNALLHCWSWWLNHYTESRISAEHFECRMKSVEWSMNELKGFEVILPTPADAEMLRYTAAWSWWLNHYTEAPSTRSRFHRETAKVLYGSAFRPHEASESTDRNRKLLKPPSEVVSNLPGSFWIRVDAWNRLKP
jgi:hypothetical protein